MEPTPEEIKDLTVDKYGNIYYTTDDAKFMKEYDAAALPEKIVPEPGAEYLIVETVKRDLAGEETISRALYGREETKFITFCRGAGTTLLEWYTYLEWK